MQEPGTVIRIEYSQDSLGGISANEYEAELHDAIKGRWPGTLINIARTINNKYWGQTADCQEIDSEDIKAVSEAVFAEMCRKQKGEKEGEA